MIIPLVAVAGLATAPAASASGGVGDVRASGACSATSHWKLKAKPDNGRIQLELEIDTNRVGQTWAVRIADNSVGVFTGNRVTLAPSGSFTVRLLTANRAGVDHFVGTARNTLTGETCTAGVNL
jgi:hypothetical protein